MSELSKKPNARMDLDGKKMEAPISAMVSPGLFDRLEKYQADFGIESRSLAIETILREFFLKEDIGSLGHISDLENGTRDLHRLTVEILVDGVVTPLERQRWTKRATALLNKMWNDEKDKQEEIAS